MRLRNKVIIVVAATLSALIIGIGLLLFSVLTAQFSTLESNQVSKNILRAQKAFLGELDQLSLKVADWANWDDSYRFMSDRSEGYGESNLTTESLAALQIDDVLYFDSEGNYYYSAGERIANDSRSSKRQNVRELLESAAAGPLRRTTSRTAGFLLTAGDVYLISASPILPTNGEGTPRGMIVFSKPLSSELISQIAERAELSIDVIRTDRLAPGSEAETAAAELRVHPLVQRAEGEDVIRGFAKLSDVFGNDAFILQITSPRDLHQQGKATLRYLLFALLFSAAVVILVLVLFLEGVVVHRLQRLSREVAGIGQHSDSTRRVTVSGMDELSATANAVNDMLVSLDRYEQELRQAKHEAEQANEARARFVANISHEVRTPVNAMVGLTEVLLLQDQTSEQREYLEIIRSAGNSLVSIINDVLDFSKLEAGKLALESIPFSPTTVVREALQMVALRAYERQLELIVHLDPRVRDVYRGDPLRLRQVLMNLLSNAVKFTESGQVEVTLSTSGDAETPSTLTWSVKDTGVGIREDKLHSVFEAFTQADGSTSRRFGGTGLGLTICKQIVDAMNGRISVTSSLGSGTCFEFSIPLEAESVAIRPNTSELSTYPVLVVGQHRDFVRSISSYLLGIGVSRVDTKNELSTQELVRPVDYGALLLEDSALDISITREILASSALSAVRKVVVIAPSAIELARMYRQLGADKILMKPVVPSDAAEALLAASDPAESSTNIQETAPRTVPLKILVVDDVTVNLKVLQHMLEPKGHQVTVASNGREALKLLEAAGNFCPNAPGTFDLILMDNHMPEMDGATTARNIRQKERELSGRRVPIIAVTASSMAGEAEKLLKSGMDDYLPKPIDIKLLFEKIHRFALVDIDWKELVNRFGEERGFLEEVVECFILEEPGLRRALRAAIETGERSLMLEALHALKGSLVNVGAARAVETVKRFESEIASLEIPEIHQCFERLAHDIERAHAALRIQPGSPSAV